MDRPRPQLRSGSRRSATAFNASGSIVCGPALGSSNPAIDQGRQATERYATRFGYGTDAAQKKAQDQLATLVPNAKHITNTHSGHAIHKEQPQLVVDTIREVVDAVRDPTSWRRSETMTTPSGKKSVKVFGNHR